MKTAATILPVVLSARPDAPPLPEETKTLRRQAVAVVVGHMRRLADAFKIQAPDWATLTDVYADGLGDLPPDLLDLALHRVTRQWSNGFRLPLPGEVRALIATELADHRRTLAARQAEDSPHPPGRRLRPETRAEAAARHQARARAMGWME